ncbi:MAG TPA: hypothetical protein DEB40_04105 [Elusimicrobia bacterium]|nr:hypothetical protein [Elusimicrobiota bacterium]
MNVALEWGGGTAGWAWALLVAAAMAWHWRRSREAAAAAGTGRSPMALRALGALALALAALRPTVAVYEPQLSRPRLLILVDNGHTMALPFGNGVPAAWRLRDKGPGTRLAAALDWLSRQRRAPGARRGARFYALSDRARGFVGWEGISGLQASAAGFHPAASLRDVLDDIGNEHPERAWLLSDGISEPDPELEKVLAELHVPLDVIGVGPSRREKGAVFADLKTPDFAFLHGRISVEATVEASALADEVLELTLSKLVSGSWTVADRRQVRLRTDFEAVCASFTATAQSLGSERYRLEARLSGKENVKAIKEFRVEVIRQKYRIMYLAGRPSPEYANLREFLKADPNHELVSFVILRNPENPAFAPDNELSLIPFPAEEIFVTTLPQFDLFILENFSYTRFRLPTAYLGALKNFVASGGALLVIGGENAFTLGGYRGTPLEDILPVALSEQVPDFRPGLFHARPAALTHPLIQLYDTPEESRQAWESLPNLDGFTQFQSVRPGSTVLAVHPEARASSGEPLPIFAIREYGRGKVMLVSSDSTWRWRLGAALDWRIATFYGRFWTKAVQYLTGSLDLSKVKFAPLADRLPAREPAVLRLRVFDEGFRPAAAAQTALAVLWTAPDGAVREAVPRESGPGSYTLELTGLSPGWHRLKAMARYRGKPWGEDEVRFEWAQGLPDAPMDRKWLRRAADASGGTLTELSAARAADLLERLSPVREQSEVKRRLHPWASSWWLALALALFLGDWALRRWKGYP